MPADSTLLVETKEREQEMYQSIAERSKHEDFLRRAADLLVERVVFARANRTSKVVEWATPDEIKKAIDLQPRDSPVTHEELLKIMADVSLSCFVLGSVFVGDWFVGSCGIPVT